MNIHLADWLKRGSKAKYRASDLVIRNRKGDVATIKLSQKEVKRLLELGVKVEEG